MKTKSILFATLTASFLCWQGSAQADRPTRSYQSPVVRLDEEWLMPLSSPPEWRDPQFIVGTRTRMTIPVLGFVMNPQRVLEPAPLVSTKPGFSERLVPPPAVNDVSRQRSHFEILHLSW